MLSTKEKDFIDKLTIDQYIFNKTKQMNKIAKILGVAAIGAMALQVPAQAETATRGAYAEVRPNGSSFAAAFETVVPDSAVTTVGLLDPINLIIDIEAGTEGTNFSDLNTIAVSGVTYNTTVQQTIEAAIARTIDGIAGGTITATLEEDVTGYIRAYVGPDGLGTADASLD